MNNLLDRNIKEKISGMLSAAVVTGISSVNPGPAEPVYALP